MNPRTPGVPAMRPHLCLVAVFLLAPAAARADDFTTEVRPILARYCLKCHGPDDKARKARLRLDDRDAAIKAGAIAPGKPGDSALIERIESDDPAHVMPPPATKLAMTRREKDVLKRWIAGGAAYVPHWAFVAPKRATPPAVRDPAWAANPIDRFVLARLHREGMRPSPRADRYDLARRVWIDLVGLPPSPEEADAFVNDASPDAYERLVDALLASPRYGERWARRWLDLARYADTNGYEKDRLRAIWAFRDWVIAALNADVRFDQFTIEQLAGDMLPSATQEQRIATGFHRNTMLNEEGGIDPLEFRFHAMTDRVATTGTTWLGLTLGCAQCHTHKYDPITHADYYRLFAFLDNADEPEMDVVTPAVKARRDAAEARARDLEAALPGKLPLDRTKKETYDSRLDAWAKAEAARATDWAVVTPTKAKASLPLLTVQGDGSVFASGDQSKSDTYELTFASDLPRVTALRLEVLPDERLPRHGPGRVYYEGPAGDFFLSELSLFADGEKVPLNGATQTFASGGHVAAKALDGDQQTGWSINGGQGREHSAVFRLSRPLPRAKRYVVKMLFERYYAAGLGRFRLSLTGDERPATARDVPADVERLLLTPAEKWGKLGREALSSHFVRTTPELASARKEIASLRASVPAYPTTLILRERPAENPRPTYLRHRGEYTRPAERVGPGTPAVLHAWPRDASKDRLGFARWLVADDNPLVGRVTVNRHWAAFFGRGLVATQDDFGLQGSPPSHPELLDWLAREFVEGGWGVKRLHRLIVTSETYRQSAAGEASRRRDAQNVLLSRGPRVRLEAEQVRDFVLRSGGLLTERTGGPSIFPPQPASVTTEGTYGAMKWEPSPGAERYRRGLYVFSKRTAPFAVFGTFDAPSGEACVARRESSNTPLQALALLNDQATLDAARNLAGRLAAAEGKFSERVERLFRSILTRPPRPDEAKLSLAFFERQMRRYFDGEADARALAGPGAGDVNERAAWVALARVLFNLDEAIVR